MHTVPVPRNVRADGSGRRIHAAAGAVQPSSKLRPLLLRRLKKQVAKDLPDRIEERRDCELGDSQRKLYLAELRRSWEQVMDDSGEGAGAQ